MLKSYFISYTSFHVLLHLGVAKSLLQFQNFLKTQELQTWKIFWRTKGNFCCWQSEQKDSRPLLLLHVCVAKFLLQFHIFLKTQELQTWKIFWQTKGTFCYWQSEQKDSRRLLLIFGGLEHIYFINYHKKLKTYS